MIVTGTPRGLVERNARLRDDYGPQMFLTILVALYLRAKASPAT